jgi:hypothetical protein
MAHAVLSDGVMTMLCAIGAAVMELMTLTAQTTQTTQTAQAEHVRGVAARIDGEQLTVTAAGGPIVVRLTPDTKYAAVVAADRSRITDGSFVGIASVAQPDGTQRATEVHVFSEALRGAGEGSYAWDLPATHGGASRMSNGQVMASKMTNGTVARSTSASASKMTNGTVAAAHNGQTLTVRYNAGGSSGAQDITIPPGIPVVAVEPGARADLVQGAHVFVVAHRAADGTLTADRILAGKNGAVPPM